MAKERIILGVDPGTQVMGYGVIKARGEKLELLDLNSLKFKLADSPILRLKHIFEASLALIDQHLPDEMAVEAPFFGKNVQSMLKLGRAQGVVMAAALFRNISIAEYSPRKVKQSITGRGAASKEQVAGMLEKIFQVSLEKQSHDASDGLAVALCHHYQSTNPLAGQGGSKSWGQFLKDHPGRIG